MTVAKCEGHFTLTLKQPFLTLSRSRDIISHETTDTRDVTVALVTYIDIQQTVENEEHHSLKNKSSKLLCFCRQEYKRHVRKPQYLSRSDYTTMH